MEGQEAQNEGKRRHRMTVEKGTGCQGEALSMTGEKVRDGRAAEG